MTALEHDPARCPDCGRIRGPKHAEVCDPPPKRACDCPPGFRHQRGCHEAYWPDDQGDAA